MKGAPSVGALSRTGWRALGVGVTFGYLRLAAISSGKVVRNAAGVTVDEYHGERVVRWRVVEEGSMRGEAEASGPHPGRMYDYIIGGTHNYEVDRVAADQFVKLMPSIPVAARLNRTFLKVAAARWDVEDIDHIVDLGSGLPTRGHLNDFMPEAQILFVDRDPVTVASGRDILSDSPRCQYLELDVLQGSSLASAVEEALGGDRRLGIGFVGLSYFFSDDQVRDLLQTLHSCCPPGSVMAMSYLSASTEAAAEKLVGEYARVVKAPLYLRAPEDVVPLLHPWRVLENRAVQEFANGDDRSPGGGSQDGEIRMHGLFATVAET